MRAHSAHAVIRTLLTPRRLAAGAAGAQPVEACQSLSALRLADTTVTSATVVAATSTVPAHCAVQLTVNNPPASDAVHVGVFLPTSSWNGRFEGVGGRRSP